MTADPTGGGGVEGAEISPAAGSPGAANVFASGDALSRVAAADIRRLVEVAQAHPAGTARLCLHRDRRDPVQEMIIVQRRHRYLPPHCHEHETESFLVLEGRLLAVFFDPGGGVEERFEMAAPGGAAPFFCRVERGRWHTVVPLTDPVVYLETTEGPFDRDRHNTYADWAPPAGDAGGAAFVRRLLEGTR